MKNVLSDRKNGLEKYGKAPLDMQCSPSPHPLVQESRFLTKIRRPQKERNKPKVFVHGDLMTVSERESTLGFTLIDTAERKHHQIEGCFWPSGLDTRTAKTLSKAGVLFSERVPDGSYFSFEELHLRFGSVADMLRKEYPEYKLIGTIKNSKINNLDFSSLYLEVKLLD